MSASEARLARPTSRITVLGLFVCIVVAVGSRARADAPGPLEVVVRIAHADDELLLERVRGQTSDLDVALEPDANGALEPTLSGQLERARDLGRQHEARVVVWFVHEERALTVFVSEPAAGRVLVRRLDSPSGQHASSAQHEAAALVVRTAMRALAEGGEIGVAEKEAALLAAPEAGAREPAPPAAPAAVRASESAPAPAVRASAASRWELLQFVGVRSAWDGAGERGQHGLLGRLALRVSALQLELRGSFGFSERVDDAIARVRMARHTVGAHLAYVPVRANTWSLSAALGAGLNLFAADVEARAAALSPRDELLLTAGLSADLTVRVFPAWVLRRVGFACSSGADVLPRAPALGYYDADGDFVRRARVWSVLPTLALELVVRLD